MKKFTKFLCALLALIMCMAFAVGCGEKTPEKDPLPPEDGQETEQETDKDPAKPEGITIGEWSTYDKDNIKNIVTTDGVTTFTYTMISESTYKNVFANVSGHDKEKNICTINVTNTGSKEINVQIAVEDEAGAADWQDPDTAVYAEADVPAGESRDVVAYLYTGKNGDVDVFTGVAYQVKVFPDSTHNSKKSMNGSLKINSVTFTTGEVPDPEVPDPEIPDDKEPTSDIVMTVVDGSGDVIKVEGAKVTFNYTADPKNTYKSIKFTSSAYDKSKFNSVRFKVVFETEGNDAETVKFVLGYKSVWDDNKEGYHNNLAVKDVSTEQVFNQDYLWGSAGEDVASLNYIELFVNSNAEAISTTLTGTFTITAEFYNK